MTAKILLIEDEATLSRNLCIFLEREGYTVEAAQSGEAGLAMLGRVVPEVVILDYGLPGMDGLEVLRRIVEQAPRTRVIFLTGNGSEQCAVSALKGGAADYLKKPMELAALRMVIDRVLQRRRREDVPEGMRSRFVRQIMDTLLRRRSTDAPAVPDAPAAPAAPSVADTARRKPAPGAAAAKRAVAKDSIESLRGESQAMCTLRSLLGRILQADRQRSGGEAPAVLITGETGTGKELVARALHFEGMKASGPFMEVNCAGIPAQLLESELFGHEPGAFTDAKKEKVGMIEAAAGGTLFLDEIGDLDLAAQAKLLKVIEERKVRRLGSLQERNVDARFFAATGRDLEKMVRDGTFRADLYFRLRMIRVQMPPLRERGEDLVVLALHFLGIFGERYGRSALELGEDALATLRAHRWEGNVRELRNAIEQAVILSVGDRITADDLCLREIGLQQQPGGFLNDEVASAPGPVGSKKLHEVERELLVSALRESRSNVSKAARILGISRDTLRYRAKKYNLRQA